MMLKSIIKNKVKMYSKNYQLELIIAGMLLIYLIMYMPLIDDTIGWCITPYALTYKYGFISRGLVGSIIRIFVPNLTLKAIYLIIALNTLVLCAVTVMFVGMVRKYVVANSDIAMQYMALMFVVNPGSVAFLFYWGNYGRFDLFMIIILLIAAMLMMKNKCLWIIPIISVGGILVHQAYVFMYFPAIIVLLLYLAYVKHNNIAKIVFYVTMVTTCAAFLYMQFCSGVTGYDYAGMMAEINNTTDLPGEFIEDDMMVRLEYFTSVFDTIRPFVIEPLRKNLIKIAFVFVIISPMIVLMVRVWKDFIEGRSKWLLIIPLSSFIGMIPKFLMTNDYGRDFSAIIISQFVMMLTLYAVNDEGMRRAYARLENNIRSKYVVYIGLLAYMGLMGKFEAANILGISHNFYLLVEKILGL